MEFKKNATITTDDFWYDLFEGGYIKPKKLLSSTEDGEKVEDAISVLKDFYKSAEDSGLLEEV